MVRLKTLLAGPMNYSAPPLLKRKIKLTGLWLSLGLIFSPYAIGQIQYDDIISDPYFFENSEDYSYLGKILVQARPEGLHGDSAVTPLRLCHVAHSEFVRSDKATLS